MSYSKLLDAITKAIHRKHEKIVFHVDNHHNISFTDFPDLNHLMNYNVEKVCDYLCLNLKVSKHDDTGTNYNIDLPFLDICNSQDDPDVYQRCYPTG
jgi:hypothetical protein